MLDGSRNWRKGFLVRRSVTLVLPLLLSAIAAAADWPQWQHDAGRGASTSACAPRPIAPAVDPPPACAAAGLAREPTRALVSTSRIARSLPASSSSCRRWSPTA